MVEKFCDRLRRERLRLGLSQKVFAEKAGVSRMTQVNYESGKRYPGEDYFSSIIKLGVDDIYLFMGKRLDDFFYEAHASRLILTQIANDLGLESRAFSKAIEEIERIYLPVMEDDKAEAVDNHCAGLVWAELNRSPVLLDAGMLAKVLTCIRDEMAEQGVSMRVEKEAGAVVMLYKAFKATGKIDREMVSTAVKLGSD